MWARAGLPVAKDGAAVLTTFEPAQVLVEHLACARGGDLLFEELSFTLAPGEALLVTGPNGAGKSSLLRLLAGLLRPAAGRVSVSDAQGRDHVDALHYVGHQDGLKPSLTVSEILDYWQGLLQVAAAARDALKAEALERADLTHLADTPIQYLSAGQRRRAGLSRLYACPRPIWLLDEPTVALDRDNQSRFADHMRAHRAGGGIVVAATHVPLGLETAKRLDLASEELA